jgi:hypothetical protein
MRATQATHSHQARRTAPWVFNLGVTRPCPLAPCVTRPVYKVTVFQALEQPLRGHSARLFGAGEGLLEAVGAAVYNYYRPDRSLYERTVSATRSQLGDAAFEEARELGKAMTFEQAVAYALEDHDAPPN